MDEEQQSAPEKGGPDVHRRVQKLAERAEDLSETLDRIEKRLTETVGETPSDPGT
jgi:hypothetical protein